MARFLALVLVLILPLQALAQSDNGDKGYLTRFLETNLSGLGREVRIDGFQGALSSRATFSRMSIADAQGVWITLTDGAIAWNRAALLSGRVEIAELRAASINLLRKPESADAPTPEATRFALPELPVSVSIGQLRADRVTIAEPVLGQPLVMSIQGAAELAGGEGTARLTMRRIDGREGEISFSGAFANASRTATLDLLAKEGPGGIAATLLGLPGTPSASLALHGSGPVENFNSEVALATDGVPRMTGRVEIRTGAAPEGSAAPRRFNARFAGDVSPLLQPAYRDFFGTNTLLEADGTMLPGQRTDLTRLVLESDGIDLRGRLGLSAANVPLAAALTIRLGLPGGDAMLLPLAGAATYVQAGTLRLRFDAEKGSQWTLEGDLSGLRRPGLTIDTVRLAGDGVVAADPGQTARITGRMAFDLDGLTQEDAAFDAAAGRTVTGQTQFSWAGGEPLRLQDMTLRAGDLGLSGSLALALDGIDPVADMQLRLAAPDMARFSLLAGRPLGGAGEVSLAGKAAFLSRMFDVTASVTGEGLSIGLPMADRVLAGRSQIDLAARRDETGISVERLDVAVADMRAHGRGFLSSANHDFTASLTAPDLSVLDRRFAGRLAVDLAVSGPTGGRAVKLTGTAEDVRFGSMGFDPLLRGSTTLDVDLAEESGKFVLSHGAVANRQWSVDAQGAEGPVRISGRLEDMGAIVAGLSGPLLMSGQITPGTRQTGVDLALTGPGQTVVDAAGTIENDLSRVDMAIGGTLQSAILNPVLAPRSVEGLVRADLALKGPPGVGALSGTVTADNLKIASPNERLSVEDADLTALLADGRAELAGEARLRGGGSISLAGPVGLASPFDAALDITLKGAELSDPNLYATRVNGRVSLTGPILGGAVIAGQIDLEEAEIQVAAPGFNGGPVPVIRHVNEPTDVRRTRGRAGLIAVSARGPKAVFGLDLTVSAPARIFVRGRGLDAEMGGRVHLRGTTDNVVPVGNFGLIRGRLNLLGKRFVLDEGLVQLQGSLVPYLYFSASSDTFGSTATIVLDGPATAPEVHFSSSTGLPEEEVISELIFGDGLNNLSTFQLVQLANAVATLSGRGGEGVVARLRRNFKLDDLDVVADEDGNSALKAGKYLSDRIYSEVSVGSGGTSKVQVEIDLNPDLKLRATVGTDGESGAGVFFDRDY